MVPLLVPLLPIPRYHVNSSCSHHLLSRKNYATDFTTGPRRRRSVSTGIVSGTTGADAITGRAIQPFGPTYRCYGKNIDTSLSLLHATRTTAGMRTSHSTSNMMRLRPTRHGWNGNHRTPHHQLQVRCITTTTSLLAASTDIYATHFIADLPSASTCATGTTSALSSNDSNNVNPVGANYNDDSNHRKMNNQLNAQHILDVNGGDFVHTYTTTTGNGSGKIGRNHSRMTPQAILQNIQNLCQEETYPVGSIVTSSIVMHNVKRIFDVFAASYSNHNSDSTNSHSSIMSDHHPHHIRHSYKYSISTDNATTDATNGEQMFHACVNAMLQLMERLSREPSTSTHQTATNAAPSLLSSLPVEYYNSMVTKWKDAAILLAHRQQNINRNSSDIDNDEYFDQGNPTIVWSASLMAQFLLDHGIFESATSTAIVPSTLSSSTSSSSTFQFIKYNTYTVSVVLQVASQQAPALLAPTMVESLWDKFKLSGVTGKDDESIVYCYNTLLQSYINSGQKDTSAKIEALMRDMQSRFVQLDMASYHIILKYYREQNKISEMEALINANVTSTEIQEAASSLSLTQHPHELSLSCWYEVIHNYTNAAKGTHSDVLFYIQKGQSILQHTIIPQWLRYQSPSEADNAELAKSIRLIITTYRNVLQQRTNPRVLSQQRAMKNLPVTDKEQSTWDCTFESAELFYRYMLDQKLRNVSYKVLHGTMMDIYANAKRLDKVLDMFQNCFIGHQDISQYNILMKAYGNCGLASESEQVLSTFLSGNSDVDMENVGMLFHTLINAWSISSAPDAIFRAFNVVRIMNDHPICKTHNVRPNAITYTTLLKCLHTVSLSRMKKDIDQSDMGRFAECIISDMEQTYNDHDSTHLTIVPYTTAIKVCLHVQDYTRAESILLRLEHSDFIKVPTKFYSELIHQCTLPGTPASAIQGEKFISHMIHLSSKLHNPSLEPNERLYVKVIDTWMKSNDIDSINRIWHIYENHLCNNKHFELSDRTYDLLIPYFAKAASGSHAGKAEKILQRMEEDYQQHQRKRQSEGPFKEDSDDCLNVAYSLPYRPNYRHYVPVIQGYLEGNDVENATKVLMQQVDVCVNELNPIIKRSVSPIRPIYFGITKAWIERGQLGKASLMIETVQEMYDNGKICDGPCIRTYSALLHAYIDHPRSQYRHEHVNRRGYNIGRYKLILNKMKAKTRPGNGNDTVNDRTVDGLPVSSPVSATDLFDTSL